MNDLSGIKHIQDRAAVEEYCKAMKSGNVNLAARICAANPDLEARFKEADNVAVWTWTEKP